MRSRQQGKGDCEKAKETFDPKLERFQPFCGFVAWMDVHTYVCTDYLSFSSRCLVYEVSKGVGVGRCGELRTTDTDTVLLSAY